MVYDNIHNPQATAKLDNNYIIIDFIQNKQLILLICKLLLMDKWGV